MIVTLEEAKTKWCPMVRYVRLDDVIRDNRPGDEVADPYCIGDQCMLWENVPEMNKHKQYGYCGLSRKKR